MKRKVMVVLVLLVAGLAGFAGKVLATPATGGYSSTTLANATFAPMDLLAHVRAGQLTSPTPWGLFLLTYGQSDVYVQSNQWPVGSSSGWHTHPGPSLIILKKGGVLTEWEWDRGACSKHVYDATNGDLGFIDSGGPDHAHVLINDGPNVASTYAVQLIPHGSTRRIDVTPAPANCGPSS